MGAINRLSALAVAKISAGKYCDGASLYSVKKSERAGKWTYIFTLYRRKREMGLGPYLATSLKTVRRNVEKYRIMVRQHIGPINEREHQRREIACNIHLLEDIAKSACEMP